jgi:hypothetical protein
MKTRLLCLRWTEPWNVFIYRSEGWLIKIISAEHHSYIKNNPKSAYALDILNNRHEYGTTQNTTRLLQTCKQGYRMNWWQAFCIQTYQKQSSFIQKQFILDLNPLFTLIEDTVRENASAAHETGPLSETEQCLISSYTRHFTNIRSNLFLLYVLVIYSPQ